MKLVHQLKIVEQKSWAEVYAIFKKKFGPIDDSTVRGYGTKKNYERYGLSAQHAQRAQRTSRKETVKAEPTKMPLHAERDEQYEREAPALDEHAQRDEHYAESDSPSSEHEAHYAQPMEPTPDLIAQIREAILPEMESRMESIAKDVYENMSAATLNVHNVMKPDDVLPPEPTTIKGEGKGRKETREYERITSAIDVELVKLMKQEMREKGMSAGRLMDAILWNRYGRPTLSYMNAETDED